MDGWRENVESRQCVICLSDLYGLAADADSSPRLPQRVHIACGHSYHYDCLALWTLFPDPPEPGARVTHPPPEVSPRGAQRFNYGARLRAELNGDGAYNHRHSCPLCRSKFNSTYMDSIRHVIKKLRFDDDDEEEGQQRQQQHQRCASALGGRGEQMSEPTA